LITPPPQTLDQRCFDRFHLVAEIVSESDKRIIDGKRDIYRAQQACTRILLVRQDRIEVTVDVRAGHGWASRVLGGADTLDLPAFGLTCPVRETCADTLLV